MRMDGVTRYRPEHDVKLLIHGPLLFVFLSLSVCDIHVVFLSTWSATFTSARICVPLSCYLATRTCSRRPLCAMTKELTTSAISAMTSWRDMLPLRGSVVPLKLSVWIEPRHLFPGQPECDVDFRKILYADCRVVCGTTMFQETLSTWRRTCSRELHRRWRSRRLRHRDGRRGEVLKVFSPLALGLRPLWSWSCRGWASMSFCQATLLYIFRETHGIGSIHAEAQDGCSTRVKEFCLHL